MNEPLDPRIQALIDKQELRELVTRYARGIDRMDRELIASVFHPDARDQHGEHLLVGDEIADRFASLAVGMSGMTHFLGNTLVEVDGDTASGETYFLASATIEREGVPYTRTRAGRYLDRFERRDGVWKIAERFLVDDWSRIDEVVERVDGAAVSVGAVSKSDPSYQVLPGAPGMR